MNPGRSSRDTLDCQATVDAQTIGCASMLYSPFLRPTAHSFGNKRHRAVVGVAPHAACAWPELLADHVEVSEISPLFPRSAHANGPSARFPRKSPSRPSVRRAWLQTAWARAYYRLRLFPEVRGLYDALKLDVVPPQSAIDLARMAAFEHWLARLYIQPLTGAIRVAPILAKQFPLSWERTKNPVLSPHRAAPIKRYDAASAPGVRRIPSGARGASHGR